MSEEKILRFDFKDAAETMREDDPQRDIKESIISFADDVDEKIGSMISGVETVSLNGVNIVSSNITIGFDTSFIYCDDGAEIALNVYCNNDTHATYIFDADSAVVTVKKDSRYPALLKINIMTESADR